MKTMAEDKLQCTKALALDSDMMGQYPELNLLFTVCVDVCKEESGKVIQIYLTLATKQAL